MCKMIHLLSILIGNYFMPYVQKKLSKRKEVTLKSIITAVAVRNSRA